MKIAVLFFMCLVTSWGLRIPSLKSSSEETATAEVTSNNLDLSGNANKDISLAEASVDLEFHLLPKSESDAKELDIPECYGAVLKTEYIPTARPFRQDDSESLTTYVNVMQDFAVLWDGPPATEVAEDLAKKEVTKLTNATRDFVGSGYDAVINKTTEIEGEVETFVNRAELTFMHYFHIVSMTAVVIFFTLIAVVAIKVFLLLREFYRGCEHDFETDLESIGTK